MATNEKLVAVIVEGERQVHIVSERPRVYATLCGIDGDDPECQQFPSQLKHHDKVTCRHCYSIWLQCQKYRLGDFKKGIT